jgi:hypothetical protein
MSKTYVKQNLENKLANFFDMIKLLLDTLTLQINVFNRWNHGTQAPCSTKPSFYLLNKITQ